MIPKYVEIALHDLGLAEILGAEDNPRIVEMHSYTGYAAKDDETAWCASAICAWLEKSGFPSTKSAAAASYLKYGVEVKDPFIGCILVTSRGGGRHHVCLYLGEAGGQYWTIGGNQSNSVSIIKIDKSKLVSARIPEGVNKS